jgi:hypothetical protein
MRPTRVSLALIGVALLVALSCGPTETTDLEIVEIRPTAPPPLHLGDTLSLEVDVRRVGGGDRATVAAATSGDLEAGGLTEGPAMEVRGGTTTLTLDVPVERPFAQACGLSASVFLVHPSDTPNLFRDLWVDPVPDNNRRTVSYAVERAIPDSLRLTGPVREVLGSALDAEPFRRHYEAPLTTLPSESSWAVRSVVIQTQNSGGMPVEVLPARLFEGTRMVSSSVLWDDDKQVRESVAQATIVVTYVDCEGEEHALSLTHILVTLAPR